LGRAALGSLFHKPSRIFLHALLQFHGATATGLAHMAIAFSDG
jgi:hypothetical protein